MSTESKPAQFVHGIPTRDDVKDPAYRQLVLDHNGAWANGDFLQMAILAERLHSFEHDPSTEAGQLFDLNAQMAAKSDAAVTFNGQYLLFYFRQTIFLPDATEARTHLHGIPLPSLCDPSRRETFRGFADRTAARRELSGMFDLGRWREAVTVNGVRLSSDGLGNFNAESQLPIWLVNLLGRRVVWGDEIQEPEQWALDEQEISDYFLTLSRPNRTDWKVEGFSYMGFDDPEQLRAVLTQKPLLAEMRRIESEEITRQENRARRVR